MERRDNSLLRSKIKEHGWSVGRLAKEIDMPRARLERKLKGEVPLTLADMCDICTTVGISGAESVLVLLQTNIKKIY